jgi:translation initiation factor 2 alpha subunit (eIF-2alpha)
MMEVLRVDEEKMCIDLSKKSLKSDAVNAANKRLKKAKQVHTIMR